jgi:hypothetical protein
VRLDHDPERRLLRLGELRGDERVFVAERSAPLSISIMIVVFPEDRASPRRRCGQKFPSV